MNNTKVANFFLISLVNRRLKYKLKENYITVHPGLEWWENHINYMVLQQYANRLSGRVVDFGSNHGACTVLAARNKNTVEIYGLDLNPNAIEAANELLKKCNESAQVKSKVKYAVADFLSIPFEDNFFDSRYMFHVIEHIYLKDRLKVLSEMKRVVKPNGTIIFALPYEKAYNDDFYHVAFYNVESIKKVMIEAGFAVDECYGDQRIDKHTPKGHDCINVICTNLK